MKDAIIFVQWKAPDEKVHRVPLVCFSNDLKTALILFEKKFIKVKIEDIRFDKWDI